MIDLSVVIPTYNERENIVILIDELSEILKDIDYEIIVSDDNSPDSTWKVVKDISRKRVKVIRRFENKGLTPAVLDGFEVSKGKNLCVIDADMSHDITKIPEMLRLMKSYEFIVGSRFIPGGGIKNWTGFRMLTNKVAALLAHMMLDRKISDPMAGFFMIRREVYETVKNKINSRGYKIMLELYYNYKPKKYYEVPYVFKNREFGRSKFNVLELINYILLLINLRFSGKNTRFIKFALVGTSGIFVNVGVLYFLTEHFKLFYLYSSLVAIEASILSNFMFNEHWTWRKVGSQILSSKFKRLLKFNLVSVGGIVINFVLLWLLTSVFSIYYLSSNLVGIFGAFLWNYFVNDRWTWKSK